MNFFSIRQRAARAKIESAQIGRRRGFTLIEILVAVAIMSLLLGIILVPLRLGFETYHIGKASAEVQQEAQLTLQQFGNDIKRSKFVFVNSRLVGVSAPQPIPTPIGPPVPTPTPGGEPLSSPPPCSTSFYKGDTVKQMTSTGMPTTITAMPWGYQPYVRSTNNKDYPIETNPVNGQTQVNYGVCDANVQPWSNTSRIDMIQVRRSGNGDASLTQDYLVSYYPRRLDPTKNYDIVDNPIVLFRAQIPFRYSNGTTPGDDFRFDAASPYKPNLTGKAFNAQLDWNRYPNGVGGNSCNASMDPDMNDRSFAWITHNLYGEANLEPLTLNDAGNGVAGAHTLVTPLGMGLVAPRDANIGLPMGDPKRAEALVPEVTFAEEATTGSRINRVTFSMTLAQYDQAGAGSVNGQAKAQRIHVSQTFDLPNAGCTP